MPRDRIYLSPPDVTSLERDSLLEAFDSGWIAPVGPHLQAFEVALADYVGVERAVALASGTAALHLALREFGVRSGGRVYCSTLTFAGSANAICHCGAEPVFIDSAESSWCMDPDLLAEQLESDERHGRLPQAIEVVDIYGQCADWDAIGKLGERYGVPLLEDAAEALGATYGERRAGALGRAAALSFNGNKMATTSGGGAFLTNDPDLADRVRFLATQAREPDIGYLHREIGFNYRLSNLCAALGLAQLQRLDSMIERRREIFSRYEEALSGISEVAFMPEPEYGRSTRWLTCLVLSPEAPCSSTELIEALTAENIEARPVWRPMHCQPVFERHACRNRGVAERLSANGVCLPSGSSLAPADQERVIAVTLRRLTGE